MTIRALLALAAAAVGAATPGCAPEAPAPPGPKEIRAPLAPDGPPAPAAWQTLIDLRGVWAFRIGRDSTWQGGKAWDRIPVPAAWEDAGYHGYDGTAWYRTTFALDAEAASLVAKEPPHLLLGRIDDTDEVWLNGERIGASGRPPPDYKTAAFDFRIYRVPPALLHTDRPNVLSVRVFDGGLEGGLLEGPVALAVPSAGNPAGVPIVADLEGLWRFSPGDGPWAAPALDDSGWAQIRVPGTWEPQGFSGLDGIAWYRTRVSLSDEDTSRDLILVLGAVDDLDEAFVNGVRVGGTGDVDARDMTGEEWLVERAYRVPASALRAGDNVVAVRVYDGLIDGGIHRGPVALMTPEAYAERRRRVLGDTW
ncbi:glycoside hydrolase [Rubrivirga sp. IMCC43871]|uniref:glycoside hydrolase n=1 Tax=Rubrivirga sp. IMCC43871 TaxID=3391575 RepID=UPI00398F8EB5